MNDLAALLTRLTALEAQARKEDVLSPSSSAVISPSLAQRRGSARVAPLRTSLRPDASGEVQQPVGPQPSPAVIEITSSKEGEVVSPSLQLPVPARSPHPTSPT